jgi:hypothetical protein
MEQLFSLIALMIGIIANLPIECTDKFHHSFAIYCANSWFKGMFGSYNTVCLFLFAFHANGGEVLSFAFWMSLLYILGNSIQVVTNDTRILALFFDGNLDVWMFFVSVSLMGRIGLFTLQSYHALFAYYGGSTAKRNILRAYGLMIGLQMAVVGMQGLFYYVNGFGNFALDFFADYVLQTVFAWEFADVHWPQIQRKVPFVDQQRVVDEVHFKPAFGDGQFYV